MQWGSTTLVKITDCKFIVKCFFGWGTRWKCSLWELRLREKPCWCNRASEGGRQQWHKGDLWLRGRHRHETKRKNLLSGLENRISFPTLKCAGSAQCELPLLLQLQRGTFVCPILNFSQPCCIFGSFATKTSWSERSEICATNFSNHKCEKSHKQKERQKSHNHINICRKKHLIKFSTHSW